MKGWKALVFALAAAAFAVSTGCSKLTYERWSTLNTQSSKVEVKAVLGDKDIAYEKPDTMMYHNPDRQVSVNFEFANDKITWSRWVDPEHGMHEIGKAAIENTNLKERDTRKSDINVP
jgi:hypothetical protein